LEKERKTREEEDDDNDDGGGKCRGGEDKVRRWEKSKRRC